MPSCTLLMASVRCMYDCYSTQLQFAAVVLQFLFILVQRQSIFIDLTRAYLKTNKSWTVHLQRSIQPQQISNSKTPRGEG